MRKLITLLIVVGVLIYIFYLNPSDYVDRTYPTPEEVVEEEIVEEESTPITEDIEDVVEEFDEVVIEVVEVVEDVKDIVEDVKETIEPVLVYDAYQVSNLTAEEFDQMLAGSPLEGQGYAFVKLEEEYGVNGLFALAVCNLESSLGKYTANTNNFFGFYLSNGYMYFDTPEEGILYFGKLMSGSLYAGKTIDQISTIYCPPNPDWASLVRTLMDQNWNKLA